MYESHYGLDAKPFQLTPDPKFFFASKWHKRALSYLQYGLSQGEGFIVITGDIGTGKTTLANSLLANIETDIVAAQIVTPKLSADEIVKMVAAKFDIDIQNKSKTEILKALEDYFYSLSKQGLRALLLVDEAQNLPLETIEELRMLSNFQQDGKPLLQSFLLGQEELQPILRAPNMEQFRQRIVASCHLSPLTMEECGEYIEYRMRNAGWEGESLALFLALASNDNIMVPLSNDSKHHFVEFREIAQTEFDISLNHHEPHLTCTGRQAGGDIYGQLRAQQTPGLVLFSSGSTGKSKAIVQDLNKLMSKFTTQRKALRMLIFLQLDHIGGVNSLLYSLANQGTVIVADDRTPDSVCRAIETFKGEVLPTSPTFLNLLLLSKAYEHYDLASLKLITYGTEPMQTSTLMRLNSLFPNSTLQQTYGLSEVGILRSKSQSSGSLWMQVGGREFITKIVNDTLWVKSDSAMLGYLNAPTPFDAEGFLDTGDIVEQDGEWIRILGRKSEIINVGGLKVYPAEVESILLEIDNVEDVVVFQEPHPITGSIVCAKFKLVEEESKRDFKAKTLTFCKDKLASYKIPTKIEITLDNTYNERFKRMRR